MNDFTTASLEDYCVVTQFFTDYSSLTIHYQPLEGYVLKVEFAPSPADLVAAAVRNALRAGGA